MVSTELKISHACVCMLYALRVGYDILGLVILEFDMQTVFNANLHLDRTVVFYRRSIGKDPEISLKY